MTSHITISARMPLLLIILLTAGLILPGRLPSAEFSVPEPLADLVEVDDNVASLPKYINGIWLLPDNQIGMSTWGDPKERVGVEKDRQRIWSRGEIPRHSAHETTGVATFMDSIGRGWYNRWSTNQQTFFVALSNKQMHRFDIDGLARETPFEISPGRVLIETYAGYTLVDEHNKTIDFRFSEYGLLEPPRRQKLIYGQFIHAKHFNDAHLLAPQ